MQDIDSGNEGIDLPKCRAERLFIEADQIDPESGKMAWVQLQMTKGFVDRIALLHSLLSIHQLEFVSTEIDATWGCVSPWTISNVGHPHTSMLSLWETGFEVIESMGREAHPSDEHLRSNQLRSVFIFGSIDQFLSEFTSSDEDFPLDALELSLTLDDDRHYERLNQFESVVQQWLKSSGAPPLRLRSHLNERYWNSHHG